MHGVGTPAFPALFRLLATHPMGKPILSGGTTGPEGSIFILAILVLMTIIVLVTLPKRHYGRASNAMAAPIFDESR